MTDGRKRTSVEKIPTGISSFDIIAKGGLPRNRTTLISGTAGSGKTIFAVQFLAAGIANGSPGVFVTFEESANDIRKNMLSFGWDLAKWEAEGKLAFVDASPDPEIESMGSACCDAHLSHSAAVSPPSNCNGRPSLKRRTLTLIARLGTGC